MNLISRPTYDPNFVIVGNTVARTMGFYMHTPKFWNCKGKKFSETWYDKYDPEPRSQRQARYDKEHAHCKRKHLSCVGYAGLILPNRSITFWYMGNPYRHKLLEISKHTSVIYNGKRIRTYKQ